MPFVRVTFDANGQAGRSMYPADKVFIVNDSGAAMTIIDGANNFTLNNNATASWTAEGLIGFTGTAGKSFLFGWGDFTLGLIPGSGSILGSVLALAGNSAPLLASQPLVTSVTPPPSALGLVVRPAGAASWTTWGSIRQATDGLGDTVVWDSGGSIVYFQLRNEGPGNVLIGDSNITITDGYRVAPGEEFHAGPFTTGNGSMPILYLNDTATISTVSTIKLR